MRAFYLQNHCASELHSAPLAALPGLSVRPPFATKEAYAEWCHDGRTRHVFYTLAEPQHPALRSSADNPIRLLHGIVADYDGAAEAIQAALPGLKFEPGKAPAWVTTTFSGKARLIWVFDRPVPVFTPEILGRFLQGMARELGLRRLLPGLDEGALANPHTPYELGTHWRQPYGDTRLAHSATMLALHDASAKAKWKSDGPEVPLEAIAAEVARRWPGRWLGPLAEGARGIRFWDPAADNPTGCTIRAGGVQAWSGEGRFIPWAELLGEPFLRQFRADRIGAAIAGTYFDGAHYWQRDEAGLWRDLNVEAIRRHLQVVQGLAPAPRAGRPGEVAQALTAIERMQRVDGAFPCLYLREELVRDGDQLYLNVSRVKPLARAGRPRAWGDDFPWLAQYLTGLFGEEQLAVFLSWLSHFYRHAVAGQPRRGQALFIAGPKSAGKTLLNQRVIGGLMGGFQEATQFVLGQTTFNESLFYAPVWAVDDAVGSADPRMHAVYSQVVKKIVANPCLEFHPKFRKAVTFRFHGRLVVTLNDDPTSIGMLPQIDGTLLDKVVILKAAAPGVSFARAEETIAAELPRFADYVAEYQVPYWLQLNPDEAVRFGHDAWHHPDLLATAKESSTAANLLEVLDAWRVHYFRAHDQRREWSGTVFDLYVELSANEMINKVLHRIVSSRNALGRDLQNMVRHGTDWLSFGRSNGKRVYTIHRPARLD